MSLLVKKKLVFKNKKIKKYLIQLLKKKIPIKKINKYKFKYKKPIWLRKSYKKFRSFIFLSKINLNSFFFIEDKFYFTKGFRLNLMFTWKKLYMSYLQFFLGLPKKPLNNYFKTFLVKSRGFWQVFNLLKKQLSFFFIFNLFKNLSKKSIILNILNNKIIRNVNLKTKIKFICFDNVFTIPSKVFFKKSKLNYLKKIYKWYFKNKIKLRLWQKSKLFTLCKIITFFNIFKLKKNYSFFLLKNNFFFNSYLTIKKNSLKSYFFFFKKNMILNYFLPFSLIKGKRFNFSIKFLKKKFYKFTFFKKISRKNFWLKKFFLCLNFKKKKLKFVSFFLYYFFIKKNNFKSFKSSIVKKIIKVKTWDFNLINIFFLKKKLSYKNLNSIFLLSLKKKIKFNKKKIFSNIRKKDFLFFKPKKQSFKKKKLIWEKKKIKSKFFKYYG